MKKSVAIVMTLILVFSLCACGYTSTSTTTTTTTTTDANGNTHTETTTTTTQNGSTTTVTETFDDFVDVPFEYINNTKEPINEFYLRPSGDESWGENLLDEPLGVGETLSGFTISFVYDTRFWDLMTIDDDGKLEFTELDFGLSKNDKIAVTIIENDDDTFTCRILTGKG